MAGGAFSPHEDNKSISALNVKWINEISKRLAQFCDVLLTLLYLG